MDKNGVAEFFRTLAPAVIDLVKKETGKLTVIRNKGVVGDYATQVDIGVENHIVSTINKHFPDDAVLAEEGYSDTTISTDRLWIIDPICGTNNLGKGINNFCTNIALVDNEQVIASCVVDHSQSEYFWSVGDGQVFVNNKKYQSPALELGLKIDVDFGAVRNVGSDVRQRHNNLLLKLINNTGYDLVSLNTSLGFAYTAIGKMDGFINVFNHPWDIAAASFLIQQTGGTLTGIDGSAWTLKTKGAVAGRTPEIHKELLDLFLQS